MTQLALSFAPERLARHEAANDATPRDRHFAAATRWAKRIPLETSPEEKRKAYERMMANLKAGLAGV